MGKLGGLVSGVLSLNLFGSHIDDSIRCVVQCPPFSSILSRYTQTQFTPFVYYGVWVGGCPPPPHHHLTASRRPPLSPHTLEHFVPAGIVLSGILDQCLLPLVMGGIGAGNASGMPVNTNALRMLRFLRLFRVLRVLKLARTFLQGDMKFVKSAEFEIIMSTIIALNAIVISMELDIEWAGWVWVENVFLTIYFLEVLAHMKSAGCCGFFTDVQNILWNYLDFVIVSFGVLDLWLVPAISLFMTQVLNEENPPDLNAGGVTSLLRLMRLFRILRLVKLLKAPLALDRARMHRPQLFVLIVCACSLTDGMHRVGQAARHAMFQSRREAVVCGSREDGGLRGGSHLRRARNGCVVLECQRWHSAVRPRPVPVGTPVDTRHRCGLGCLPSVAMLGALEGPGVRLSADTGGSENGPEVRRAGSPPMCSPLSLEGSDSDEHRRRRHHLTHKFGSAPPSGARGTKVIVRSRALDGRFRPTCGGVRPPAGFGQIFQTPS